MSPPRLILASASPRRALLLSAAGIAFTTAVPEVDETPRDGEPPMEYVLRVCETKAASVERGHADVVLGADTTVVIDDVMLGKPTDADDALGMLERLAGRTHVVMTGWSILSAHEHRFGVDESRVTFHERARRELIEYIEERKPFDKAGSYAIQGDDGWLIASVEGSRSNVMGLPVRDVVNALAHFGIERSAP